MRAPVKTVYHPNRIPREALTTAFMQRYGFAQQVPDGLGIEFMRSGETYGLGVTLQTETIARAIAANPDFDVDKFPGLLAKYDGETDTLVTYPTNLSSSSKHFLRPKYRRISSIAFQGYGNLFPGEGDISLDFEDLPLGFVRQMFAGFGVNHEHRFIIEALERAAPVQKIIMCEDYEVSFKGDTIRLPYDLFDRWRRALRRSHNMAVGQGHRAKDIYLRAQLAKELGLDPEKVNAAEKPADLAAALMGSLGLKGHKRQLGAATAAVRTVRQSLKSLADAEQTELLGLNREIELLTLEELMVRLEEHIAKRHPERFWQSFFKENPFILRLAFGLPVVLFGDQVAVGGTRFDGSGGKFADFVLKAGSFGNLAILEIKTPQTDLIAKKAYRGDVYAPTSELTGAVNQVLDQRYRLQLSINEQKIASNSFDVYGYAMQCLVIAGRDPGDEASRKSLELFRNGLKDVLVVTFDELLSKLKALHIFLSSDVEPTNMPR